MLSKAKIFNKKHLSKGFTLLEALVSTAVFGLGFVGVYTIVAVSEQTMVAAAKKQKMQMIADQIIEVVSTDIENIDSYDMDLTECESPLTSDQWDVRQYQWCTRLNDEIGPTNANDDRSISITTIDDDTSIRDGLRVLHVLIEGNNEKLQISVKRTFDD